MLLNRKELAKSTDTDLFLIALNCGFRMRSTTSTKPVLHLNWYGTEELSDYTIPYVKDRTGLPVFSEAYRNNLIMLLDGKNMID